jgi:hypothetical protein
MNRLLAVAAVVLLTSCATASEAAEREIRAQYDKVERAFEAQDIDAVLSVRDPPAEGWKIRKVDQIDLKNRKRWIDGVPEAQP